TALNSNNEVEKLTNGKYHGITYFASKFYLCNYDENGKPVYSLDTDCFAYTFALSETEHNKSISYPNITTILFDEFITKHIYLNDEFVLFMNTISTIVRQRTNVKIYMCGNTVNKFCPYFQEMGLTHILEMKQGTIDVYTYGDSTLKVAVEYCTNSQHRKENNFYFAFNNPKLNMITGGAWELDIYPHLPVKYQPKNIQFIYFIEFNGFLCQCEVIEINGEMFTFIHQKTTPLKYESNDLIYTLDFHYELNYNRNICKPQNTLQKRLLWFFETNRVFYQNNEIGDIINNYLKLCKGGVV
ncbi:MAG: phage DNA encapsidation protein, partial [Methanosphaera sp.]|nr:phage DNA encapsidation protein [Methanosphaera sp.]